MFTLSRLQPHQIVQYDSRPHRVVRVNECRAALVPVNSKGPRPTALQPGNGKPAPENFAETVGISPNSEIPIIGRWDHQTATAHYFPPAVAKPTLAAVQPVSAELDDRETPVPLPITFIHSLEQVVTICADLPDETMIIHHIQTELF